jgi:uncharacterized membrane protein YgdD (TMEM256/DUF423 family)
VKSAASVVIGGFVIGYLYLLSYYCRSRHLLIPAPSCSFITMSPRIWIVLGALSAAAAVGWGAFHAHGLIKLLDARGMDPADIEHAMHNFDVAVRYQAMHAIGLILVGLMGLHATCKCLDISAFFFAFGTLLFSASLETAVLLDMKLPWFIVPAGGAAFIAGWVALAIGAIVSRNDSADK